MEETIDKLNDALRKRTANNPLNKGEQDLLTTLEKAQELKAAEKKLNTKQERVLKAYEKIMEKKIRQQAINKKNRREAKLRLLKRLRENSQQSSVRIKPRRSSSVRRSRSESRVIKRRIKNSKIIRTPSIKMRSYKRRHPSFKGRRSSSKRRSAISKRIAASAARRRLIDQNMHGRMMWDRLPKESRSRAIRRYYYLHPSKAEEQEWMRQRKSKIAKNWAAGRIQQQYRKYIEKQLQPPYGRLYLKAKAGYEKSVKNDRVRKRPEREEGDVFDVVVVKKSKK
jgi:hypothetical protein